LFGIIINKEAHSIEWAFFVHNNDKHHPDSKLIKDISSEDFRRLYTLSDNDVLAVLNDLIKAITRHLTEGEIVKLGDFGNFQITLSSEGKRERDRVTGAAGMPDQGDS